MSAPLIGLQMYSMKQSAEYDFFATLDKVKQMGYEAAELVGYYTFKPDKIRKKARKLKLAIPSVHTPLRIYDEQKITKDFKRSAKYVSEIGAQYIVIPWLPFNASQNDNEITYFVHVIGSCLSIAKEQKLQLVIHHYAREFLKSTSTDNQYLIDEILNRFPDNQVMLQLDTSSLYKAGLDPFSAYCKYEEKVASVHLRDITLGRKDCCLGQGEIDFTNLPKLPHLDQKFIFLEQQHNNQYGDEHAAKNLSYIRSLLYPPEAPKAPEAVQVQFSGAY